MALAAGLGLLQGCTSTSSCSSGPGIGHGELLQRMGLGSRSSCECSTVSSGGVVMGGNGSTCGGPYLDPQGTITMPPGVGTEPPVAPTTPRPFYPPQAQPTPAGPVSKVKTVVPGQ
jgi:hypothetical protein